MLAQLLVIPVLSRLLSPEDYGLVAMAMPFVLFTMCFTDAGVGQSLIRTSREERDVWSTSFWLTVLLGLGLMTIIAATALAHGIPVVSQDDDFDPVEGVGGLRVVMRCCCRPATWRDRENDGRLR